MLVQLRRDRLRLIRQHDHALAAGELAHAWREGEGAAGASGDGPRGRPGTGRRLPFRLVLAVALHDVAWRELDGEPRYDPDAGRPYTFDAHPLPPKLRAYRSGLDAMEAVDPRVGLLGSLHYASFLDEETAPEFLAAERQRQRRLLPAGAGAAGDPDRAGDAEADAGGPPPTEVGEAVPRRLRRELRWLKFFDGLSIRLCLSPPAVPDEGLPAWLDRRRSVETPEGAEVALRWRGDRRVELEPWPLAGPLTLSIPVRDLPERSYPDAGALERAWSEAGERAWTLRVAPPRGSGAEGG